MSVQSIYRWTDDGLEALEYCDMSETSIVVADSWLVTEGTALALEAHRTRFLAVATEAGEFWDAAIAAIPLEGDWFPRVELHRPIQPTSQAPSALASQDRWRDPHSSSALVFRLREAPERHRSVVLATWTGGDPWTQPTIKGPDLERMLGIRTSVQSVGAGEAALLSTDGYVVEGATTALLWWRGDILCGPSPEFGRVDSVTARSVLTLATALGIDTFEEAVTPAELDGTELWALNALHGIRIVTQWVDGPQLAEQPGRLATWRKRMDALRRPIR